jgi:hypothetical protein
LHGQKCRIEAKGLILCLNMPFFLPSSKFNGIYYSLLHHSTVINEIIQYYITFNNYFSQFCPMFDFAILNLQLSLHFQPLSKSFKIRGFQIRNAKVKLKGQKVKITVTYSGWVQYDYGFNKEASSMG